MFRGGRRGLADFWGKIFSKTRKDKEPQKKLVDKGFLVFDNTSDVIKADRLLTRSGFEVRVMGPPPELRTGCDLVIEFPLMEQAKVFQLLSRFKLKPFKVVPVTSPLLEPVSIFQVKDFGPFIMVRAANMKISVDKSSLEIVNISGGGCPDVPFVAAQMVGKTLRDAPSPLEVGHTLCSYALYMALQKAKELCLK